MKVAVVGVTGLVGQVMLKVLEERDLPVDELIPVASERSKGKKVNYSGKEYRIEGIEEALGKTPDIALFSAGGDISREWAPKFADTGTRVIDNSSAFRMDDEVPLVVPEVNGAAIQASDMIIANPNCSTIQLVMVLDPIHKSYGVDRVVISTYQSITGSGQKAVDQLNGERENKEVPMAYPYKIDMNCLPHCDDFNEHGYTKEEVKLMREPLKIMSDASLRLTATAVRVPVKGGHSEAVNLELKKDFDVTDIQKLLSTCPGVKVQDNPDVNQYPMPLYAEGKDEVFVGRIRRDTTKDHALDLWIVADNLRKGAATNAVQIAETLLDKGVVGA